MKHYMNEFDDNCYYLDILRWFRDNFVSSEDKKEYYEVAAQENYKAYTKKLKKIKR